MTTKLSKPLVSVLLVIVCMLFPHFVSAHEDSGTMHLLDNQYDPTTATIYKGEQITFENISSQQRWPDLTYTIVPKHKTYEFASLQPLTTNQKWVYKFPYAGKWHYADKKNPNINGTINVIVGRGYSHVIPQQPVNWWDNIIQFLKSVFHIK